MRLTLCLVLGFLVLLPGCKKKNTVETPLGTKTAELDPNADPRGDTYGDKVLPAVPAERANKDQPLRRHSRTPWFRLSNVRTEDSEWAFGGRKVVLIDFSRVEAGEAQGMTVRMMVRSKFDRGPAQGIANFDKAEAGTMRLSLMDNNWFGIPSLKEKKDDPPVDLEIYLEQAWGIGNQHFKVSNSVFFGGMEAGGATLPREWNEEEEKVITRWVRTNSMLPPPPEGYVVFDGKMTLLPGAPILTSGEGHEWQPAEFIRAEPPDQYRIKSFLVLMNDGIAVQSRGYASILIDEQTIAEMKANPGKFKPSIRLLETGKLAIPDGWVQVDATTPLVKGVTLQCPGFAGSAWEEVTVMDPATNSGRVKIHWNKWRTQQDEEKSRDTLIVAQHTLGILQQPNADEKFADNAFKAEHDVQADFPAGYIPLPPGKKLVPGMAIQARQGIRSDWQGATILAIDGPSLSIRWSGSWSKLDTIDSGGILVSEQSLADLNDPKGLEEMAARAKAQTVGDDEAPAGYRAIDEQTRMVKGIPVKIEDHRRWVDRVVLRVLQDNTLMVGDPDYNSDHWDKVVTRDKVIVSKEVLESLDDPKTVAIYAKNLKTKMLESRQKYRIEIAVPQKAVVVTKSTPLEAGVPLGLNSGFRWYDVTVVDASDDEMVRIEGDAPFHIETDVFRENLIIEKVVLAKLERQVKAREKEKQVQKERAAAGAAEKAPDEPPPKESPFKEE